MIRLWEKRSTTQIFFQPIGTADDIFGPPSAARPQTWETRAYTVKSAVYLRENPLGGGEQISLKMVDGGNNVIGSVLTMTSGATALSGLLNAAFSKAGSAAISACHSARMDIDLGAPAVEGRLALVYQDDDDPSLDFHATGDGARNHGMGTGTSRFIAINGAEQLATAATENTTVVPWPTSGVFKNFLARYSTGDNAGEVAFRVNGSDEVVLPLAATAGGSTLVSNTSGVVNVDPGDLVNFRVQRLSGTDTTLTMYIQFNFQSI